SFFMGIISLIPTLYHYGIDVLFVQKENIFFSFKKLNTIFPAIFDFWFLAGYDANKGPIENRFRMLLQNKQYIFLIFFLLVQIIGYIILVGTALWVLIKRKIFFVGATKKFTLYLFILFVVYTCILMFSKEKHRFHYLHPFFLLAFLWILHIFSSIKKIHIKIYSIVGWFAILFCYYICVLYVNKENKYPHYYNREKAFNALQKKEASLFETYRYLEYTNQPKKR
ncbi:MAG: hypothetical protein ACRC0A_03745, partial [Chitinophagaceae bacterium]